MDPLLLTDGEEWRNKENEELEAAGFNPNDINDYERLTHPALAPMKSMYKKVPKSEVLVPDAQDIAKREAVRKNQLEERAIQITTSDDATGGDGTLEEGRVQATQEQLDSQPLYSSTVHTALSDGLTFMSVISGVCPFASWAKDRTPLSSGVLVKDLVAAVSNSFSICSSDISG